MARLKLIDRGGYLAFDEAQCRAAGRALAGTYRAADPFPHVVIEDFLDAALLRDVVQAFPVTGAAAASDRDQERLKRQFRPEECSGLVARNLFAELNSQAFLGFLEEMTGLSGLITDPYFAGAGLHETQRGGHLGIHADFNRHEIMNVERRLNLLIYLNDDWDESYGGALELWDRGMTECRVRVLPTMARAVIFATDLDSYHGHPDALTCPPDRTRRSIATYYYKAPDDAVFRIDRTTNFRRRPGSVDKRDWRIILHHIAVDWAPPALRRRLRL